MPPSEPGQTAECSPSPVLVRRLWTGREKLGNDDGRPCLAYPGTRELGSWPSDVCPTCATGTPGCAAPTAASARRLERLDSLVDAAPTWTARDGVLTTALISD